MTSYFVVPGRPVPKGRPRFTRHHIHTPQTTIDYEKLVVKSWQEQSGITFAEGEPLWVVVTAHFEIPSSLSKKKQEALVGTPHTKHRGDIDNIVKSVLDALNGHAFPDDCAVYAIQAEKIYGREPRTEVTIRGMEDFLHE